MASVDVGFGELLRHYRSLAGLTQEQLAERAGLSRRGIADLERGARQAPHAATIERLAAALGLSATQRLSFAAVSRRRFQSSISLIDAEGRREAVGGNSANLPVERSSGSDVTADATRLHILGDEELSVTRGVAARRHTNLPVQSTSFVGRDADLSKVAKLLESGRLVTLTGTGGVGKTRLAIETAGRLLADYADGVWLVELAPVVNSELVPRACATVLGVQEKPGSALTATLVDWLRDRQTLLLLDNCEHLIESCAQLADTLLRSCRNTHILATSRELLGINGESLFRVEPLSTPATGVHTLAESVLESESVKLFSDRAQTAATGFVVTNQNAEVVARICERLDGIPLALELAAARLRALLLAGAAASLRETFGFRQTPAEQALVDRGLTPARSALGPVESSAAWAGGQTLSLERAIAEALAVYVDPP